MVSQQSDMDPTLLILGGTREASDLAQLVAEAGLRAVLSYAGRVDAPRPQPVPVRVGGFGGVDGLARYLQDTGVTHLVDATHPFADQMSRNAIAASERTGVPLAALTRPPWSPVQGDRWQQVADMDAALAALDGPARRVFLAIGRTEIARFAALPQHHYVLRLVDAPEVPPPLPRHEIVLARGPFDAASDEALLRRHQIDIVVSKNSGGDGARAKLDAARQLGLPVIMIDRPALPSRVEFEDPAEVLAWLDHPDTLRGV